jgi:hypothetical protein
MVVLAAVALMGRRMVVRHPTGHHVTGRQVTRRHVTGCHVTGCHVVGRSTVRHRPHPVHVAPQALGVAEPHLAQESQEDEHAAEAEREGRGTTHRLGCYAD